MTRNKIKIYCDEGTNDITNLQQSLVDYFEPLGIAIETTRAEEIIAKNSLDKQVLSFVMPGGRASPYYAKLQEVGNQKIRDYVAEGGIYLGICAGAYYASQTTYFEQDINELALVEKYQLNLIQAEAIGTLYKELKISPFSWNIDSLTTTSIRWCKDQQSHVSCYHGGPYFAITEKQKVKVLTEYEIENQTLPAILHQKFGKGDVIVSGVHFEDSAKALRRVLSVLYKDKRKAQIIADKLAQHEDSRQALFNKVMQNILTTIRD